MKTIINGKEENFLLKFSELEYDKEYVGNDGYLYCKYRDTHLNIDTLISNKAHLNDETLSGLYEYDCVSDEELGNMYFIPLVKKVS